MAGGAPSTPRRARRSGGAGAASAEPTDPSLAVQTPEVAEYATVAESEIASAWPPLDPKAGTKALSDRFLLVMGEESAAMPTNVRNFKPETFRTHANAHLREHGLLREEDGLAGTVVRPIIQRPPFERMVFLVEPPAEGTTIDASGVQNLKYYSVPEKALATTMVGRGFKVIGVTHLPADESRLPQSVGAVTRGPRAPPGAPCDAAPAELTLPTKVPRIDQAGTAAKVALQIVEHFELKVKEPRPNGKFEVYAAAPPP